MSYQNYTVEIPLGLGGLDASKNTSNVDITRLIKAKNVEISDRTIKKEGGTTNINSSALGGAIVGGCDYWPTTAVKNFGAPCNSGIEIATAGKPWPGSQVFRAGESLTNWSSRSINCSRSQLWWPIHALTLPNSPVHRGQSFSIVSVKTTLSMKPLANCWRKALIGHYR